MTDREKLMALLNKSFEEQYGKRGLLTAQHTATDLLTNGVTFAKDTNVSTKWIPVSERLPESGKDVVFVALRWGEVDVGWCEDGVWGSEFVIYEYGEVTHWMPLPEPPKGE